MNDLRDTRGNALPDGILPFREIDYRAMLLLAERSSDGSALGHDMLRRKLEKAWRRGQLFRGPKEEPQQRWRMCEARLMLGHFADWSGWEYRDPWVAGLWHNPGKFRIPAWDGKHCAHLFLFGEQGVGDEVFFAGCLPDVLKVCPKVTLDTDPRLASIFQRSFGISTRNVVMEVREGRRVRLEAPPEGTRWLPLGDLPRIFRLREPFQNSAWLKADPEQVERFAQYRGRVGISWRGAQGEYPLREFGKLVSEPLSLQYDMAWDEDAEQPEGLDLKDDFEGLLGLLSNLSRVVTVSTSVAHFACALGVKTDVILAPRNGRNPTAMPWRWGLQRRTPWYESARVWQSLQEYRSSQ